MAINGTLELIDSVTVPSGGQAAIEFTSIPQTYDDLVIKLSGRSTGAVTADNTFIRFNGVTTGYSYRFVYGNGSGAFSSNGTSAAGVVVPGGSVTAGTFGNAEIYISNYAGSTNKSYSVDGVTENNATTAYQEMWAHTWANTSAITSVAITNGYTFAEHSTAYLYGVTRVPAGAKATGGVITETNDYWIHTFTSSSAFTPLENLTVDYLVVAGGGSGGSARGGGGGAGGLRSTVGATGGGGSLESQLSLTANNSYTVTIGAGGATATSGNGNNGSNSVFATITSIGGGGGGNSTVAGLSGGSGGGAGNSLGTTYSGGSGTANQGYSGGSNSQLSATGSGGGAGGAGASNANGGIGVSSSITGSSVGRAGGGGGSNANSVRTGSDGGGNGGFSTTAPTAGTINTGGGGGGNYDSGAGGAAGGSGIVIVRYAK